MTFATFRTATRAVFATLAVGLPAATAAEEGYAFTDLDPALLAALERGMTADHLKALGVASFDQARATARVRVGPADCPPACNTVVTAGLCGCQPERSGSCSGSTAADTKGGGCTALPETVDIFASDGGLGTTRVRVSGPGRGD